MRIVLILLLIALGVLIGWLISYSSYEGIEHNIAEFELSDTYFGRFCSIIHG
jgi:hypothetical protein